MAGKLSHTQRCRVHGIGKAVSIRVFARIASRAERLNIAIRWLCCAHRSQYLTLNVGESSGRVLR